MRSVAPEPAGVGGTEVVLAPKTLRVQQQARGAGIGSLRQRECGLEETIRHLELPDMEPLDLAKLRGALCRM